MKAELALDLTGRYIIIGIAVAIGITVLTTLFTNMDPMETASGENGYDESHVCQQYGYMQEINSDEMREIINARYHMSCEQEKNVVTTEHIISKTVLEDIAEDENIMGQDNQPKIVYRPTCERMPGYEGLIVEHSQHEEDIIFYEGETINITESDQAVKICEG